jgi:hypothetical protein
MEEDREEIVTGLRKEVVVAKSLGGVSPFGEA